MVHRRLPVPVTVHGPLKSLALRVHILSQNGRCDDALAAADAYEAFAGALGDEKAVAFLYQGRMYAYEAIGRTDQAITAGEESLRRHRAAGNRAYEAKALSDVAALYLTTGRIAEAMDNLARAGLLLDALPTTDPNYVSALGSYGTGVHAAELYEAAHEAYQRLAGVWAAHAPDFTRGEELGYMMMLLVWGLRLDHLGHTGEATAHLSHGAAIGQRWIDTFAARGETGQILDVIGGVALALAKLGDAAEAGRLAERAVVGLREREDYYGARVTHLALGLARRAQGDFATARRELLAAEQLLPFGGRPEDRLIIRYELAALAAEAAGTREARDLLDTVREQARQLWRLRLERVGMLRQAHQRVELETERVHTRRALLRDPLTGLGNRRHFDELIANIDAGTVAHPTVLLLLDLDRFKAINDGYSHSVGDEVLCAVARTVQDHCRADDVAIRYAGDEFTVFLHADLGEGLGVAERIRAAVRALDLSRIAPGLSVSVSVGIALLRPGMSGAELFRTADHHLYEAKLKGRDRIAA